MNIDLIRAYALKKKGVTEEFPFDETTLVFKVMGKMFLLASLDSIPLSINLKCDPERAVELRERYEAVLPGYHMNKTHWNTVIIDGSIPDKFIIEWIDDSYQIIIDNLSKANRKKLDKL
ncbi:MAG: MmcQ/YjbR family DNA-binding protein [Ignavibacteriaceae bacterium]|nr:MmcQ/YjbR family DNA-binding protein [Ignavibacteriaceae bacterium]